MIKLIIVDDEMLVVVGLKSMIDWASLGIEIAGTAHNGAQALELIETVHPDIMLIDINMPVKDGLETAKECREKYGMLPVFIFLTSYEEFSFAREAVSVQAIDYLVKISLTPEQLTQTMKKAISAVQEIKGRDRTSSDANSNSSTVGLLKDRFFIQLLTSGFESPVQLEKQASDLGIKLESKQYSVIVCRTVLKQARELSKESLARLYTSTIQTAEETASKYFPCTVTGLDMQKFAITVKLKDPDGNLKEIETQALSKLREVLFAYFSVDLFCSAGIPVCAPMDIPISYQSACKAAAEAGDHEPIVFAEVREKIPQYHDRIIENVQEYIRRNITRRLSLNDVAEEFGFTPGYLSQLFAKSGSTGFVEYVTGEKIAAAKKILQKDSSIKVYELADQLGFESAFYFSTVFKKVTGCSPSDYRDSLTSVQQ